MPTQATIKQPFGESAEPITQITDVNVGAVNSVTGLSVVEQGDAVNHKTVLTMSGMAVGSAVGAAALAFGKLLYTLPAGAQLMDITYASVALTGTVTIVGDTPEIGIGSVIASGAVLVLNGTATFMDYVTEQTSGAISGSNTTTVLLGATAGIHTGIALNIAASAKTIHLNVADTWAGAGDVTATGTVTLTWKFIA